MIQIKYMGPYFCVCERVYVYAKHLMNLFESSCKFL